MRNLILFLVFINGLVAATGSTLIHQPWEVHINRLRTSTSLQQQEEAVKGMLQRLLGDRAAEFNIKVDPSTGSLDRDSFKISAKNGTANITGSTGVAASSGVLYYLKYYCFCHVSWEADQLDLPHTLPDASFERTAPEKFRYYFNICTLSYSTPWWTWKEWERGIDWMALNGINLILAPIGQEDVWRRVFLSLGLNDDDLKGFFAGPPFMAWNRMGNIQGWGGPVSLDWLSRRASLNKQIVGRMREFGMMPILPAFAGHVPEGLQRLYPSANITRLSAWSKFTDPYTRTFFLDPHDPLFKTIGSNFVKEVNKTFGSDHLYSCDPFNEMTPVSSDPTYLQTLGSAVLGAMTDVDPLAVWVMQGWMFVNDPGFWQPKQIEALLTSVPQGKMIILDLAAEILPQYRRTESFYGQPFIFCMLHNYGGVQGLFGNVDVLLEHMQAARANSTSMNITIVGTGMTPEGINQNYVMYDLFTELMWITDIKVSSWAKDYAKRRYGSSDKRLGQAWQLLLSSIYNCTLPIRFHGKGIIITRRPKLKPKHFRSVYNCNSLMYNHGQYILVTRPDVNRNVDQLWYSVADLVKAWDLIMAVANGTSGSIQQLSIKQTHQDNSMKVLQRKQLNSLAKQERKSPHTRPTQKLQPPTQVKSIKELQKKLYHYISLTKHERKSPHINSISEPKEGPQNTNEYNWKTSDLKRYQLGPTTSSLLIERLENSVNQFYPEDEVEYRYKQEYKHTNLAQHKRSENYDDLKRRKRSSAFVVNIMKKWKKMIKEYVEEEGSCDKEEIREEVERGEWRERADDGRGHGWDAYKGSVQAQETFKHDVVDITRQMLQLIGGNYSLRMIDDYKNGVLLALRESSKNLQDLLADMDSLLASSPAFLLGPWVEGAAAWGANDTERSQFVVNALHQITLWGPTGEILDYAVKQWSGVFSDYLRGRWALFAEKLEDSLVSQNPFDQPSFNFEVFEDVERKFAKNANASYPTEPIGNTLDLALQLYKKYRPVFNSPMITDFDKQYQRTVRKVRGRKN